MKTVTIGVGAFKCAATLTDNHTGRSPRLWYLLPNRKIRVLQGKLTIRPAEVRETASIRAVIAAVDLFPTEVLDEMIEKYFAGTGSDLWFIAEAASNVFAFSFCEPERITEGTWNLLAIGVLPDHQGQGVGAAMLKYLEATLAKAGARVVIVETMGTAEFEATRRFYLANGYAAEARIRKFYEAGADKVVFWKHL